MSGDLNTLCTVYVNIACLSSLPCSASDPRAISDLSFPEIVKMQRIGQNMGDLFVKSPCTFYPTAERIMPQTVLISDSDCF